MNNQKEQSKPDWEIVAYKMDDKIFYGGYVKTFYTYSQSFPHCYSENDLIKYAAQIHSVKRLSDGEVFSVGEKVGNHKEPIAEFKIIDDGGMYVHGEHSWGVYLSGLQKSKPIEKERCGICGGEMVMIRGRYPHTEKRNVCPTCVTERLEQIQEISSSNYGQASKIDNENPIKK